MTESNFLLPVAASLPFLAALIVAVRARALGRNDAKVVLGGAVGSFLALLPALLTAGVDTFEAPWLPSIGVSFALRADGFALLLALLVSGIGALVALYALTYMTDEEPTSRRRFYAALAVFMGSMLGLALADDLILLFVFWEITSLSSFLLIGYRFQSDDAKDGAITALQVTAMGGLAMSVGFLLIGQVTGTFSISRITQSPELVEALLRSPLSGAALLLVLLGAFTKSAQVPFHFWLPRAMVAPTPVSAYLHAATMVKAGVFLLGRMHPLFGEAPLWMPILVVVGATSMLLGAYQAFRETDLKAILARTTASALGMITLLYGLGATAEASLQILNHALYKGALFLVAGIVEHHAHTRQLPALGGLARPLPRAFLACALAAASMAGFPPLLGFAAKDSFYATLLHSSTLHAHPTLEWLVVLASFTTSVFLVATAGKLALDVFLGPERSREHAEHDSHAAASDLPPLWWSPLALASLALFLGLLSATPLVTTLATAVASGPSEPVHATLFPALAKPLLLSLLAIAFGTSLYAGRRPFNAIQDQLAFLPSAARLWATGIASIARVADAYATRWQNGSLRWYLAATVLTLPVLCAYALHRGELSWANVSTSFVDLPWYGFLFCVLLVVATIAAVRATTRLAAAIATTTIGFLVAMLFVVYRSPDILLTQVLIETVATIFLLLVLALLPPFPRRDLAAPSRLLHAAIAGVFGMTISLLILLAMTPGFRETDNIAVRPGGLLSLALAEGGGANAVNVIIVDIRALDTTGEITVVMVVGLCVYGVLRSRRRSRAAAAARSEGTIA